MAKGNRKPREKSPERVKLDAFDAKFEGKELTNAQKEERATLHEAVKRVAFKKNAEMYGVRALTAIEKLSALANTKRYSYTPAQIDTLKKAINGALGACFAAFDGKVTAASKLAL